MKFFYGILVNNYGNNHFVSFRQTTFFVSLRHVLVWPCDWEVLDSTIVFIPVIFCYRNCIYFKLFFCVFFFNIIDNAAILIFLCNNLAIYKSVICSLIFIVVQNTFIAVFSLYWFIYFYWYALFYTNLFLFLWNSNTL